jgi:hypothetical protein|nr:MAG TPA: hypothetical protein [Caudoviricetes sp.]
MEELKKLALQAADDIAKTGATRIVLDDIAIDIRRHKLIKNKLMIVVTDLDGDIIFEYYTSLVNLEYDLLDLRRLALDYNIDREGTAFLGYFIEAWYYEEIK